MRRLLVAMIVGIWALASIGTAWGHGLEVTPPDQEAVVDQAVSTPFAQAHCRAAAPAEASAASGGVVTFKPAEALPCPPVANPGGQTTGP